MTTYSRRALVGDIGGTNIRLAITDIDELTISDFALLSSGDFEDPREAIEKYLKTIPDVPSMVGLAIAGPVSDGSATMTNRPWRFDRDEIRAVTKAEHVHFVNDFEALALSLPHLTDNELHQIGGGAPVRSAAMVVLGPGTGLGVAALVDSPAGRVAAATEGGPVTFGAVNRDELALLRQVVPDPGYLGAEEILSGRGLVALYRALSGRTEGGFRAPDIVERALTNKDPLATRTLAQFVAWLGRFAADVALAHGARGGVYIAGGIAPNIVDAMVTGAFRAAFDNKGSHSAYVASIPIHVIKTGADAGLRGAAIALSQWVQA